MRLFQGHVACPNFTPKDRHPWVAGNLTLGVHAQCPMFHNMMLNKLMSFLYGQIASLLCSIIQYLYYSFS